MIDAPPSAPSAGSALPPLKTHVLSTGISRLAVNAVVATTVLTFVATTLAIIRFVIRRKNGLGKDDYVLMVALVFVQLQMAFCYMIGFLSGSGWEMQDLAVRPERITWTLKLIYFPEISYTIVATLIKTSILLSYLRIFGATQSTKWHIYALLALSWAWGVAMFFTIVFQCTPIRKAWEPQLPGHCIPTVPFLWGNSISNFVIDWLILIVPVIPVIKLQLPPQQKLLVVLTFLIGSLACIASTVRSANTGEFDPANLGIADYKASVWVYVEIPLATISCCLPFLSRIFGIKAMKLIGLISNGLSSSRRQGGSGVSGEESLNGLKKSNEYSSSSTSQSGSSSRSQRDAGHRHDQSIRLTTTTSVSSARETTEEESEKRASANSAVPSEPYITTPAVTQSRDYSFV